MLNSFLGRRVDRGTAYLGVEMLYHMRYINYRTFFPGDEATDLFRKSYRTQIDIIFLLMLYPVKRSKLELLGIIAIKAFESIVRLGKLYTSYSSEYTFSNIRSSSES